MNYFGQWSNLQLVRQDGTTRLAADVLRDVEYVILLFGASWNGETQLFFPTIERFYEDHHTAKSFEVVYVSRDYNRTDMMRGFLSAERDTTAAARQQRRDRKEERHRQSHTLSTSASREGTMDTDAHSKRSRQSSTGALPDREVSKSPLPSTAPPPLKRVAELTPVTAPNSFSGPAAESHPLRDSPTYSGGFWAVPYDHVGVVGVPILYHLRVFSYPGVVVCRNKPLHPTVEPLLLPELKPHVHGERETSIVDEEKVEGEREVAAAAAAAAAAAGASTDSANAPQRRQKTPMVARRECYPAVVTIAGRFMMETEDTTGENFPWEHMGSPVRFAAMFFFAIVVSIVAVVLSVVLPAVVTMKQAKRAAAASRAG